MFKKKTSLNIRPEPPSVAEITEDINSADSSDVVFARSNNGTTRFDEFLNDYMSLVLKRFRVHHCFLGRPNPEGRIVESWGPIFEKS